MTEGDAYPIPTADPFSISLWVITAEGDLQQIHAQILDQRPLADAFWQRSR